MKFVRYERNGTIEFGSLDGDIVRPFEGNFPELVPASDGKAFPLAEARLLTPVRPGKIVAVGPNYRVHLKGGPAPERPMLWLKPSTALCNPGDPIVLPSALVGREDVNHEAELAIVIGRRASNVTPEDALSHVFGYTNINDVTAGNLADVDAFRKSMVFVDGKVFDSFAPMGPYIETEFDPGDLSIQCKVNGVLRQDHRTSDMIWPCAELISLVSRTMTLEPGDVIATGSPPGSAGMRPGDVIEIQIEGLGVLRNPVTAQAH